MTEGFPLLPSEIDAARQSRNHLIDQIRKQIRQIMDKVSKKYP